MLCFALKIPWEKSMFFVVMAYKTASLRSVPRLPLSPFPPVKFKLFLLSTSVTFYLKIYYSILVLHHHFMFLIFIKDPLGARQLDIKCM